ncbi:hypothetical protein ACFO4E_08415 [Nocardiopsis mangrovi]|uniref:Transcriptional regulator SbtR-like C-terminal domain-containing protein n=1 Tax=Nocardiopsis mangrovi TaxID=1179818 RepID=A0ABV9DU38_9ACTN
MRSAPTRATRRPKARAGAALARLIQAGQADGDIRPDVTVDDIYLLFSTAPTARPPAARARWLTLTLTGLATGARPTWPVKPATGTWSSAPSPPTHGCGGKGSVHQWSGEQKPGAFGSGRCQRA